MNFGNNFANRRVSSVDEENPYRGQICLHFFSGLFTTSNKPLFLGPKVNQIPGRIQGLNPYNVDQLGNQWCQI